MEMENRSEDEVDELEEMLQKHRKEKKELQGKFLHFRTFIANSIFRKSNAIYAVIPGKIQALKKSASKGDKKKKKEVAEEIARLELEINRRHDNEIEELKAKVNISLI